MSPRSFAWPLAPLANGIWTASTPIRFAGVWFPHVMTVVRLQDGSLVIHSPCRFSTSIFEGLAALGTVMHVIAPNWFHDLYLADYRNAYPRATFWGPPLLQKLKGKHSIDATFDDRPPWNDSMPHYIVRGLLTFDEALFFHRATATLIVADLLMNLDIPRDAAPFTRLAFALARVGHGLSVFPLLRLAITDRCSLENAAIQMAAWAPQNIIVAHGSPIASDASRELLRAIEWLLPT